MKNSIFLVIVFFCFLSSVHSQDILIDINGNVEIGTSNSDGNLEVFGASGEHGIVGSATGTGSAGVYGENRTGVNTNYGILGYDIYGVFGSSMNGYAGYFQGDTRITGDLTVDGLLLGSGTGYVTGVTAGTGLTGGGTSGNVSLDINFAGTGGADTASRSDHDHDLSYSPIPHDHDAFETRIAALESQVADLLNAAVSIPSGSFVINNDISYSTSLTVDLNIDAANTSLISVSEDINFVNASWETYQPVASYTFDSEGSKKLYMKLANSSGLAGNPISDWIVINTDPRVDPVWPDDQGLSKKNKPTLQWSYLLSDVTYHVQLASDASFANIIEEATNLVFREYTVATMLSRQTTYYWRVSMIDENGTELNWSGPWSFTTPDLTVVEYFKCDVAPNYYIHTMSLTHDGTNLWVSEETNNRIHKIDNYNNIILSIDGPASSLKGIAHDGTYLWVQAYDGSGNKTTYQMDSSGNIITSFISTTNNLTHDGSSLWGSNSVSNASHYFEKFDSSGALSSFQLAMNYVWDIASDNTYIWAISDDSPYDKIYKIDKTGSIVDTYNTPGNISARGIAHDGNYLWLYNHTTWPCEIYKMEAP